MRPKYLRQIVLSILVVRLCIASAFSAVLDTEEWESKPGAPWSYYLTDIDCTVPPSPAGGCALRFTYPAGTYSTSFSAGRAEYDMSGGPTTLYFGAWMRYSNPFTFNPIGHKVNFFVWGGPSPGCDNAALGYGYGQLGGAPQICWADGTSTTEFLQNVGAWDQNAHLGEWHWYEMQVTLNTPGVHDGIFQIWIDDALYLSYSNVPMRDVGNTNGFISVIHTGEWGGGGGTLAGTQYWWVDHTVISTTRIGMPGGTPPPLDTASPSAPLRLKVS